MHCCPTQKRNWAYHTHHPVSIAHCRAHRRLAVRRGESRARSRPRRTRQPACLPAHHTLAPCCRDVASLTGGPAPHVDPTPTTSSHHHHPTPPSRDIRGSTVSCPPSCRNFPQISSPPLLLVLFPGNLPEASRTDRQAVHSLFPW